MHTGLQVRGSLQIQPKYKGKVKTSYIENLEEISHIRPFYTLNREFAKTKHLKYRTHMNVLKHKELYKSRYT